MKTKLITIASALAILVFASCDKQLNLQHKYHGSWEITKYEYFTNSGGGNYTLVTSHSTASDTAKSFFLLYDRMDNTENYNYCLYQMPPGVNSPMIAGLGNDGATWWYSNTKGTIIFWDAGYAEHAVSIEEFSSKKLDFSYSDGTGKEVFYMERADLSK